MRIFMLSILKTKVPLFYPVFQTRKRNFSNSAVFFDGIVGNS